MQNAGISTVLATNAKYFIPNTELKEGQIVVGKVNELEEDGTARIIINGKIITATVVEEALSKGKFYFEVKDFKDGKVELKVISEIKQNDQKNSAQILKELDIPVTKDSEAVIKLFLQSERAITKSEVLEVMNQLLKTPNKQLVLDSLSFLMKKNYPINGTLLQSLVTSSETDLSKIFSTIENLSKELTNTNVGKQLHSMINLLKNNSMITDFQQEQFRLGMQLIADSNNDTNIVNTWNKQFTSKEIIQSKPFAQEVFQNIFKLAEHSPTVSKAILNMVSDLPEFSSVKTELTRVPLNLANQLFSIEETSLIDDQQLPSSTLLPLGKNEIIDIKNKIDTFMTKHISNDPIHSEEKLAFITQVLSTINEDGKSNQLTKLFLQNQLFNGVNSNSSDPVNELFQLLNKDHIQNNDVNADQMTKQIKNHQDLIGFNTESKIRDLSSLNKAIMNEQFPTLKEIALKALNSNLPEGIKHPIEQLITKITASQITMIHQNGPEYNYSTVVPLFLNNWSTDLTIQWTGKESSSNSKEIQSNHCHILFFLELETLKETMVDVSIQNRVVNVTIFNNNTALNAMISSTQPLIKESLAKHDFQLSMIKCLPFNNEREQKMKELKFNNSLLSSREYTGVDLLI